MSWITDLLFGRSGDVQNTAQATSQTDVTVNPEVYVINDFAGLEPILAQMAGVELVTAAATAQAADRQAQAVEKGANVLALAIMAGVVVLVIRKKR